MWTTTLEKKFEVFDIESFEKAAKEISSDLNISEEDTEKILMDTMEKSSKNEDGISAFTVKKAEDTEKAQYEIYRNYDDNFIIQRSIWQEACFKELWSQWLWKRKF